MRMLRLPLMPLIVRRPADRALVLVNRGTPPRQNVAVHHIQRCSISQKLALVTTPQLIRARIILSRHGQGGSGSLSLSVIGSRRARGPMIQPGGSQLNGKHLPPGGSLSLLSRQLRVKNLSKDLLRLVRPSLSRVRRQHLSDLSRVRRQHRDLQSRRSLLHHGQVRNRRRVKALRTVGQRMRKMMIRRL